MKSILLIIKHNLKMYMKTKELFFMFTFLLVITLLIGTLSSGSDNVEKLDIGFVVNKEDVITKDLENRVLSDYNVLKGNKKEIEDKVLNKNIEAAIEINNVNIEKDIVEGKDLDIKVVSLGENETKHLLGSKINIAVGEYKSISKISEKKDFNYELKSYVNNKIDIKSTVLEDSTTKEKLARNILGVYTIGSMLLAISVLSVILKEKKINTYQRMCTAPIKERDYILGCVFSCYILLLVQMILQIGILKILNLYGASTYIPIFIIMLLMGLCVTSIGMVILVFSPSAEVMGMMGGVITAPLVMLSGMIPYEVLPNIINKVSVISPIRWGLDGYTKIINGESIESILFNLLIILLITCVLLIIATIKMQVSREGKTLT